MVIHDHKVYQTLLATVAVGIIVVMPQAIDIHSAFVSIDKTLSPICFEHFKKTCLGLFGQNLTKLKEIEVDSILRQAHRLITAKKFTNNIKVTDSESINTLQKSTLENDQKYPYSQTSST